MQRKVERLQKEREAEKPRRGRWKGDDAGTRQRQLALIWLPAAAESARPVAWGERWRLHWREEKTSGSWRAGGRGTAARASPACGRLESERAAWGPKGTCGPAQKRPARGRSIPSPSLSILPVVRPATGREATIKDWRTGMGLRRKLAPACGAGDEECVRIFAFGRWGNDPARPCRWSATAACFWKASGKGEKSQHYHPRRRDESSPDGGIGNTLYGPAFMPCLR